MNVDEVKADIVAALHLARNYEDIKELHFKLNLLEYLLTPKPGFTVSVPQPPEIICATLGCLNKTVVNFPGGWFCRDHYPPIETFAVGAHDDHKVLVEKGKTMIKAWNQFLKDAQ